MFNTIKNVLTSRKPSTPSDVPDSVTPTFGSFNIDEYRPMRIAIIGAGASGILAGIRFRQYIPNIDLTIYEQMDGIGGTWFANRYPGVACDNVSHSYQFSFEQKPTWSSIFASGSEICQYFEGLADKYQLRQYIKLRHELIGARYDDLTGKWNIKIRRPSATSPDGFEEFEDRPDFVCSCIGVLHRWKWPDIQGLDEFKGLKVHSANWNISDDEMESWKDKKVAVVGLGSSAMQIVGALGSKVGKLYNVTRNKSWVALPLGSIELYKTYLGHEFDPTDPNTFKLTEEEQKPFEDPERFMAFRKDVESIMNGLHTIVYPESAVQKSAQQVTREYMQKALEAKPGYADALIPDYSMGCRRLTPTPGYLRSLCRDNVELVKGEIERIAPDSIELAEGRHLDVDVIIFATGFDTTYKLPFPIIGRNGTSLEDKWSSFPKTYLSLCADGFPNMFFVNGPNSCTGTSTLLIMMEHMVMYAVHAAQKLQRERLKSIEPKAEAVADFDSYTENHFKQTVYAEPVPSWYKPFGPEGRVVGLWPGSPAHMYRTLRYPRWEDFNYERLDSTNNRLYWLGDGMVHSVTVTDEDRAWYLQPSYLDIPPVPSAT